MSEPNANTDSLQSTEPKEWKLTEPDPTEEFPVLALFTDDSLPPLPA